MLKDSPNMSGGFYTAENDPRILPMGKFLRKTKINELPQLVNILKGDMSVIGYRPQVKKQYDSYEPEVRKAMAKCRPGLSGIGPIVFRSEEQILQSFKTHEERDKFYKEIITPYKGQLEVWYSKHRNVFMYFTLIFMTVRVVLNPKDDSWKKLRGIPEVPSELEKYF
jgi:lipopolysaccharide/colanic/teichoic acid biosynthesis glycosyltransferase